ncbi:hypothetical protein LOK49_LG05G02618 [Camellia lanceoleosa]|uniref:Uncharacterized protein n=1 Tax=Camellia lanceoleosa TaxID=1840588 RepID=A0ACC0HQ12_9ERIC|nr:hypothetical protein LOK49_LG05G02618 [Camellia lanceoleosa]
MTFSSVEAAQQWRGREEHKVKIWPQGSLEEKVQNLLKSWEMEIFHKKSFDDFKTMDPKKAKTDNPGRNSAKVWGRVQPTTVDLLARGVPVLQHR